MRRWFANLSVLWKVLLAPAFFMLVIFGNGVVETLVQRQNQTSIDALIAGPIMQAERLTDFTGNVWRVQTQLYQTMAVASNETDEQKMKANSARSLAAVKRLEDKISAVEGLRFDEPALMKLTTDLKAATVNYVKRVRGVIDMAEADAGSAMMLMMGANRDFAVIEKITDQLVVDGGKLRDTKIQEGDERLARQGKLLSLVLGVSAAIGIAISLLIGRSVARPFQALVPELTKLAEGDFNLDLPGRDRKDEVGQISTAIDRVVDRIGQTIGGIKIAATEVSSASAEISTSTTDLSERTEKQAATLEETSASMAQISTTVRKNAESARQANEFAGETNRVAERGGAVVAETVTAMARIEESSRRIADIITVIDEIARQTNLLALNAAVEAARAGEAGRGFAVVASEVRSLAQRSSQAAKDIKDLITNSSGQVKDGVELVNRAGVSLNEIVAAIQKVTAIVSEIASASNEQSTGIDEINKALSLMDETTQQNSALVEENAATAKTLEDQARSMDERVSSFRLRSPSRPVIRPVATATGKPEFTAPLPPRNHAGKRAAGKPVVQMRTTQSAVARADTDWKEF